MFRNKWLLIVALLLATGLLLSACGGGDTNDPSNDPTESEEPAVNEEPADQELVDEEPADEQPADEQPADEKPADETPAAEESTAKTPPLRPGADDPDGRPNHAKLAADVDCLTCHNGTIAPFSADTHTGRTPDTCATCHQQG